MHPYWYDLSRISKYKRLFLRRQPDPAQIFYIELTEQNVWRPLMTYEELGRQSIG
jgi:hypothetical protein